MPRMARFTILKWFILLVAVKNFTSCQLWGRSVSNGNAFIPYLSASDFIFTRRVTFRGLLPVVSSSIRCKRTVPNCNLPQDTQEGTVYECT